MHSKLKVGVLIGILCTIGIMVIPGSAPSGVQRLEHNHSFSYSFYMYTNETLTWDIKCEWGDVAMAITNSTEAGKYFFSESRFNYVFHPHVTEDSGEFRVPYLDQWQIHCYNSNPQTVQVTFKYLTWPVPVSEFG